IWYDEDIYDLRSAETEFPAIVFNDNLTSNETLSCEPTVSSLNNNEINFRISFDESDDEITRCIDDLDFFKDFEHEFPAIVYNDALTSKLDFSTEPTLCPQHIDVFDLKDETSLSKYDEVEQNVLYFNDLFPFTIIYPDDLKSNKDNDDNEIDIIQSSGGNENTQGSNKLPEASHDKINKNVAEAKVEGYTEEIVHDFEQRLEPIFRRLVNRVHTLHFEGLTSDMRQDLAERLRMVYTGDDGHEFRGARRSMTWRQFILALGFHTAEEMADDGFGAYWLGSERVIPNKRDLSDYWVEISSGREFLRGAPSYTYIRDLVWRLYHRHVEGRKSDARLSGGNFIGRLAHHFGLVSDDGLRGLSIVTRKLPLIDMGELVKLNICMEIGDDWAWGLRQDVRSLRGLVERSMTDQGRFSTWMVSCMTQLMEEKSLEIIKSLD
ncbi:hypothetical protein Tco_0319719, partial [Tanacetum coccineum]